MRMVVHDRRRDALTCSKRTRFRAVTIDYREGVAVSDDAVIAALLASAAGLPAGSPNCLRMMSRQQQEPCASGSVKRQISPRSLHVGRGFSVCVPKCRRLTLGRCLPKHLYRRPPPLMARLSASLRQWGDAGIGISDNSLDNAGGIPALSSRDVIFAGRRQGHS